ncbi:MAG: ABC transporter permease [Anaerolineales bacterium]|nr:ABC transporter permease [Anaerolineales bacterium]
MNKAVESNASDRGSSPEVYDSASRPAPVIEEALALLRYRDLIRQLIARSIKTRYKRSVLGVAWTMLNPLLTMLVLTLVFSGIFRYPMQHYALYVLSGLLLWNFFSQTTTAAMGDLIWSGGLISRIFIPKSVFAVAAVGTGLVNILLALVPYLLISVFSGGTITAAVLFLPVPVLLTACFALGVGLAVSSLAIYFPDIVPMYEVVLTAWMYLTPAIYPLELVPENIQQVIRFNPMYTFIQLFRVVLYEGRLPDGSLLLQGVVLGFAGLLIGWVLFNRKAREYSYRI